MTARHALPAVAPRGKHFVVQHFATPLCGTVKQLLGQHSTRVEAERAAARIDERLSPFVVLVGPQEMAS